MFCPLEAQTPPPQATTTTDLSLEDFLRRVLRRNETLQTKLLDFEANRRRYNAERGVFEPELVGSGSHEVNNRQNTAEQSQAAQSSVFHETNNIYQGGLESLVPSGARVRLGYTLRDLRNNLQANPFLPNRGATNGEYQTFFGITVNQPLLKNFGFAATMAGTRLAALSSKIAFQEYRRQLMTVVSAAEASYWNLYLAQEQVRFFHESVKTAETILVDNRARWQTGKGSELEVLEAEAGLALRRSKFSEAEQKLYEAVGHVVSLYSEPLSSTNAMVRAVDPPQLGSDPPQYDDLRETAFGLNPDYLIQRHKLQQESVKVSYARNQRLPELDLKSSYGLNGLGNSPAASWKDVEGQDFPSWTVGLEMRIPLAGGAKVRNELSAAQLLAKSAAIALRDLELQILNGLDTTRRKIKSARDGVAGYRTTVTFSQSLLDSALERLSVGKIESRKVLEAEADLLEARTSLVEALVQYQRASLELQLVAGAVLKQRNLEISQAQLGETTREFVTGGRISDEQYHHVLREVQLLYQNNQERGETPEVQRLRRTLRQKLEELNPGRGQAAPPPGDSPLFRQLRRLLHDKIRALELEEDGNSKNEMPGLPR